MSEATRENENGGVHGRCARTVLASFPARAGAKEKARHRSVSLVQHNAGLDFLIPTRREAATNPTHWSELTKFHNNYSIAQDGKS